MTGGTQARANGAAETNIPDYWMSNLPKHNPTPPEYSCHRGAWHDPHHNERSLNTLKFKMLLARVPANNGQEAFDRVEKWVCETWLEGEREQFMKKIEARAVDAELRK